MNIIEQYNRDFKKKSSLKKDLIKYVSFLILKKEITISVTDYSETQLLLENKILKNESKSLKIENYTFIAIALLEYYKTTYSFDYSTEFELNILFFEQVKEDFTADKYSNEYAILELELLKIIIYETNKRFNYNFNSYINELSKTNDSEYFYNFIDAYSAVFSSINIDIEVAYNNSIKLLAFTKSDATFNFNEGNVLNGIKQKCFSDEIFGLKLFKFSLDNSNEKDDIIISAIVPGIYEKIGYSFYKNDLKKLIDNNIKLFEIINGLSNISIIKEKEYPLFISLFNQHKANKDLIIPLAKLLFAILKSENLKNNNLYTDKCFEGLNEIIVNESSSLFILHNTTYLENNEEKRTEIIINIINQSYFSITTHLTSISHFFWKCQNIQYLKQILIEISKVHPFKKTAKYFNSRFKKFDKIEFETMYIDFLTDNKANLRFLGVDIFNNLGNQKFNSDILKLEPIKQYKLWVCLTQTYKEPKYIIPFLLPLVDSRSTTIKECFILKLKEYSENYGGHLTELLETNLDSNNINHSQVLKFVIEHMHEHYEKNIHIKYGIKELNPYYSNNKILDDFNLLFNKKMRRGISGTEKTGFLAFSRTIHLAKGGGWKNGDENEIMKLGKIQTSFALPRNYFINPNDYEIEEFQESNTDWNENDFKLIESWISNE